MIFGLKIGKSTRLILVNNLDKLKPAFSSTEGYYGVNNKCAEQTTQILSASSLLFVWVVHI